jgi:1-aminocyclopropane-1-carboxylate deaminase/D-cysteine desulfhydrase-like pyridoxal-dependent ACC family enzyme
LIPYSPTPIQEIHLPLLEEAGVQLLVKREDLNHPFVSGNKWWKLKYNLEEAIRSTKTILTFGGAYSNHLYATAAAAFELEIQSIGIVRGELTLPLNHTLSFVKEKGMRLEYVSREKYRTKTSPEFIAELKERFGDFYSIPEGGTNSLAIRGCIELAQQLKTVRHDCLMLPVGTGGTIAGLILGFERKKKIIGVSVLKGDFHYDEISQFIRTETKSGDPYENWSMLSSYHHGGYGKVSNELLEFIQKMREIHNLPLDPVYTGKLLWAVMEEVKKGSFARGTTILALHTGGLQGG